MSRAIWLIKKDNKEGGGNLLIIEIQYQYRIETYCNVNGGEK